MKNKIKIAAFIGMGVILTSSAITIPISIVENSKYALKVKKEQEKKEQIKKFSNISFQKIDNLLEDVNAQVFSRNNFLKRINENEKNDIHYQGEKNFIENKNKIKSLAYDIKNGEVLISDILKEQERYKKDNQDEFNKIINDYNLSNDEYIETDNIDENSVSLFSNIIDNSNIVSNKPVIFNENEITMSKEQFDYLKKVKSLTDSINKIVFTQQVLSGVSIACSVVAWGVSAFYWSAWWMFGANIPFTIAATTQAVTLTIFNGFAIEDMVSLSNDIKNSNGIFGNNDVINFDLSNKINYVELSNNMISLSMNKLPEVMKNTWIKLVFQKSGFTVIKNSAQKLQNWIAKKIPQYVIKKIVLISTAWANPIITAINVISNIINVASLSLSITTMILATQI